MTRNLILMGFMLAVLSAAGPVRAAVSLRAEVDRTRIAPGESISLTVTVSGGDAELDTSSIADFAVHPRGTSSHFQIVNGRTARQVAHNYLLIPRRSGELTIPALSAVIDGQTYQTDPIRISVAEPAAADPADPGRDVFVTAAVSDPQPWAGQQLIYTFSLYNAVQVTDARFQPPEFKGFMAREIEQRRSSRTIVDGREYALVEIDYVLVPLAPGPLTIEPAVLQVGIVSRERRRSRSPFDDFFDSPFLNRGAVIPKVVQSEPLEVAVRALPPFAGPGDFSGLVGQFDFSAAIENNRLQVGDSTTLTLTIEGKGNIMDAQRPDPGFPEGIKIYADAPQEQVQLGPAGYAGRKVFRLALVPVKPGKFELPLLALTYFDIVQGRYRTVTATLPAIYATPAADSDTPPLLVTPQMPGAEKQAVAFTGRDILPLKQDLDALTAYRQLPPLLFGLWLILPAAAFGVLLFVEQVRRRDTHPRARMRARAYRALKAARGAASGDAVQGPADALTHLYQALTAAICAAAGCSGEALTWKEAENLLIAGGLDQDAARRAAELLSAVESAKFSGVRIAPEQFKRLVDETGRLVHRLAP